MEFLAEYQVLPQLHGMTSPSGDSNLSQIRLSQETEHLDPEKFKKCLVNKI